jgi:hypothetical protein
MPFKAEMTVCASLPLLITTKTEAARLPRELIRNDPGRIEEIQADSKAR